MRVAVLSYEMLFQRVGGLQVQVRATVAALRSIGVEARLFDIYGERLTDFDVVHVFSAINGNHRIVEAAKAAGIPVVLSAILHPPWTRWDRHKAECCDRLIGRVTSWSVTTSYRQILAALEMADRVVALGSAEKLLISEGYGIDSARVKVVPNGVSEQFFSASADLFRSRFEIEGPFVLCVASISPYKNQLGLAKAVQDLDLPIVLVGDCPPGQQGYLDACRDAAGERLIHAGVLAHGDPLLASAYAAATVFALPSESEVAPISVMEALAAGTPAVLTRNNSLELSEKSDAVVEVDPDDTVAIRAAVSCRLSNVISPEKCRALVQSYTWNAVAEKLQIIYQDLLLAIRP